MKATVEGFSIPSQQSFSDRRPRYLMMLIRHSMCVCASLKETLAFYSTRISGISKQLGLKQYVEAFVMGWEALIIVRSDVTLY